MDREISVDGSFDRVFEIEAGRIKSADGTQEPPVEREPGQPLSEAQQELVALGKVPIFAGLSSAKLKLLALVAQRRDYAAGDVVYSQGDVTEGAYIVLSGELEVTAVDASRIIERVGPGEIAGDITVIADVPHPVSARTNVATTALFIDADTLREMINNDVGVASAMLSNVSTRVVRLVESLNAA
jgi:CRP-like cAMP-binding protein